MDIFRKYRKRITSLFSSTKPSFLLVILSFILGAAFASPQTILAQPDFGEVDPHPAIERYGGFEEGGPTSLLSNLVKTLIAIAGIYAFFNILLAGYVFISADGDPKKIQDAWSKIWQSLLGLAVAAGAFVLAAIIGRILFGDENALLQIRVFGL